ncbi:MAG TPA: transaldolase [Steroidobacteraceae bacterium]|nr:transaldolase [Steroidobacteraceae bacterium]
MKTVNRIHDLGQSLWIDEITRRMLDDGSLQRYIDELAVTGLTSNPTIFEKAIAGGDYDAAIAQKTAAGRSGEALFVELALEDLRRAADLFKPIHDSTAAMDGWVSMEVSPLLAADTAGTIAAAARIHRAADRPNLFVKIPGTPEGVPAIEESIFDGIPVNVTLLFSPAQYRASAEAYLRGIERRVAAGRDVEVTSVASLFVSRWDKAVESRVPVAMHNRLGIGIAGQTYAAYLELFGSARWKALEAKGARKQRLLMASTGTKDPAASPTHYVEALVAPETIDTVPLKTLEAAGALEVAPVLMSTDAARYDAEVARFTALGIDTAAIAAQLQREGAEAFVKSWNSLMERLASKSGDTRRRASG